MNSVRIETLVFGGQGLAHTEEGKPVFLWNALPGELVEYEPTKKRKGVREGIVTTVLESSPERVAPEEAWYLSTSPWSMMTFEEEQRQKQLLAQDVYQRLGGIEATVRASVSDGVVHGYRNKMEFSFFTETPESPIELAFFERGKKWKTAVSCSLLASDPINTVAVRLRDWLRSEGVDRRSLKTVIVRSNAKGQVVAALFVKKPLELSMYPELDDQLIGLQIYFSNPKSPASVPTDLLYSNGSEMLQEDIAGRTFSFGALSFFQVNVPVFERALQDMMTYVQPDETVLDYYAGSGSIGLSLAERAATVTLIESNPEAAALAQQNIETNAIANATVVQAASEDMTGLLTSEAVVILDPPRAGLHKRVVETLLSVRPKRLIYLSCNLSTQARDVALLQEAYDLGDVHLYNFFPRTPHMEGLIVLDRKS